MLELGNLDLGERMERKEEALGGELIGLGPDFSFTSTTAGLMCAH